MSAPISLGSQQSFDHEQLLGKLAAFGSRDALICGDRTSTYADLIAAIDECQQALDLWGVRSGAVVALRGDCSENFVGLFFALAINKNVIVPINTASAAVETPLKIAGAEYVIDAEAFICAVRRDARLHQHQLIRDLQQNRQSGLVLFSSGSTGESKGVVLSLDRLLHKLNGDRPGYRTMIFLLMDHIGGINTMLNVLAHGGSLATITTRSPDSVAQLIEKHRIELLPTTPTFLNMMLMTDADSRYDLRSLKLLTYGTEPMPQSTLREIAKRLPHAKLKQTYGLSELGVLPTRSESNGSLWLRLGGHGTEYKVVDGMLWVRTDTAMLGYLNANAPFDAEGWFATGDMVEKKSVGDVEYLKILGRKSDVINVGGEKVYPAEVESVLRQAPNMRDVTVYGKKNPVTGQIVAASVALIEAEDPSTVRLRLVAFCREQLASFKVPALIEITEEQQHNMRFKKIRPQQAPARI